MKSLLLKVWDPDNGEEPEEFKEYDGYDLEDVAQQEAESFAAHGDYQQHTAVCIRDTDGDLTRWDVEAEQVLRYNAVQVDENGKRVRPSQPEHVARAVAILERK